MAKRKQQEMMKATIQGLVEGAAATLRELGDEMQSWYDNMPENLQGGDKGSTIESTAETLTSAADDLEMLNWPEALEKAKEAEFSPNNKKRQSRADRCSQATYELGVAIDALRELAEDAPQEQQDEFNELADSIEEAKDNADGAEFPGMMG